MVSTGAITSGGAPWSWPSSMTSRAPGMASVVAFTVRWNQSGLFAPPSTSTGTEIFARSSTGIPWSPVRARS